MVRLYRGTLRLISDYLNYGRKSQGLSFTFRGANLPYFFHNYNRTWGNERTVEVPVIWALVRQYQGKKIFELGNVLSHYFTVTHDVLDKYERGKGIINEDILTYQSDQRYHLIVSISTLEHISHPAKAFFKLYNLLLSGGRMVVTYPYGFNKSLDNLELPFSEVHYMKRFVRYCDWWECSKQEAMASRYDGSGANGIVIGYANK